ANLQQFHRVGIVAANRPMYNRRDPLGASVAMADRAVSCAIARLGGYPRWLAQRAPPAVQSPSTGPVPRQYRAKSAPNPRQIRAKSAPNPRQIRAKSAPNPR